MQRGRRRPEPAKSARTQHTWSNKDLRRESKVNKPPLPLPALVKVKAKEESRPEEWRVRPRV